MTASVAQMLQLPQEEQLQKVYLNDPISSNQAKLMALKQKINDLHQWAEAGERQPADSLDCIEWELQNLSLSLQPPPSPTPTEPFGEVIHQYMDTLCTIQKQSNLKNSLLQDIGVFNAYDSTKLEEWLTYRNSSRPNKWKSS